MGTIITVFIIASICVIFGLLILSPFFLLRGIIKRWKIRTKLLELELQDKLRDRKRDDELIGLLSKIDTKEVGEKDPYAGSRILSLVSKES
jgi:hypothetical protein